MRIYKTSKTVLSVSNNIDKFLPGITANTLDAPHNAFLSIHGRIVATFDQVRVSEDQMLLCVEKEFVEDLLNHVQRYLMLSGSTIEETDYAAYFDLDNEHSIGEDEFCIAQPEGKLVISQNNLEATVSDAEFISFRLDHNLPQQGLDYRNEMVLNVSVERFTSFTKGCYLGQEAVSKVYNRSKPTWRLEVKYADECSEEEVSKMTSRSVDPANNRERGFVFIKNE